MTHGNNAHDDHGHSAPDDHGHGSAAGIEIIPENSGVDGALNFTALVAVLILLWFGATMLHRPPEVGAENEAHPAAASPGAPSEHQAQPAGSQPPR